MLGYSPSPKGFFEANDVTLCLADKDTEAQLWSLKLRWLTSFLVAIARKKEISTNPPRSRRPWSAQSCHMPPPPTSF